MKNTAAAIIAAASFSLLTTAVSAETLSNQEWVNSQYNTGPGIGVTQAPRYEFSKDPQDWTLENMNSPRKVFKRGPELGFEISKDPQDWTLENMNSPRKVFKN